MKFSVNTIYYFLLKATHPSITVTVLHFFWKANRTYSAMLLRILRLATGTELSPCFCSSYIKSSLPYLVRKEKDTLIITRRHQQSLELEVVVHHHILDKLMRMANEHIVLLEILLIARNVLIINTDWSDKMTKETN